MAKSSKKSKEAAAPGSESTAPGTEIQSGPAAVQPVKATKRKKTAGRNSAPARKTAAARKPRPPAARKTQRGGVAISDDEIRIRAYFISEQRTQSGLAGDSAHDWLEARRQLQAEAKKRA